MSFCGQKLLNILISASKSRVLLTSNYNARLTAVRCYKRSLKPMLRDLYRRRVEQGPEPERPRSAWLSWNHDAEMFSFGKRLGEDFNEDTLRTAFTHRSYVELEQQKRDDMGMTADLESLELEHNEQLAQQGENVISQYTKGYLRHTFPKLPEEGVQSFHDYLTTDDMLAYVASNMGVKDLILSADFPHDLQALSGTFKAVVGALAKDQGSERAGLFVQDLVLTQLIGKNLNDLWNVTNPVGLLEGVLDKEGQSAPEPRLLWQTGTETIMACYMVGMYVDKQLIGKAPGETVSIAEQMAARDALSNIFGLNNNKAPLKFNNQGHRLKIDLNKKNISMLQYMGTESQSRHIVS